MGPSAVWSFGPSALRSFCRSAYQNSGPHEDTDGAVAEEYDGIQSHEDEEEAEDELDSPKEGL